MDDLERLVAQRECERLTHRYCRFADFGQASRLAELFTQDGVFALPEMVLTGRSEIARTFAEREALTDLRTVHLCTNLDVEVLDEQNAQGWVYLCLFRRWREPGSKAPVSTTAPALVAAYEDTYAWTDDRWLIRSRTQHVAFADPADTGWTRPS
jgi:hypothetical protein